MMVDELFSNIEREIAAVSCDLLDLKPSKIGFSVWTSSNVPVVAMQKKSSFLQIGIECTLAEIKNLINIRSHSCFI